MFKSLALASVALSLAACASAPTTPGSAPTPSTAAQVTPPPGCRFHPRCPHAMRICADTVPVLTEVGGGEASACWLHATHLSAAQRAPLKNRSAGRAAFEPPPARPPSHNAAQGKET